MTADDSSAGASARRPTIQDVAAAAGVSRALVSIVLRGAPGASEATRLRVREVAQRLGYRPDRRAQQLRESRSRTVGVSFEVRQAFHGDLVETLYTAAADRGFSLLLSASARTRTEGDAVQTLLDDRPEALVLIGSRLGDDALRELRRRLPVVVLARTAAGVVDAVRTDDAEGARRG
ncbi:LacI family DNA-binding transcriptional regulator, partial [Rathayibacter tanaceti]